MKHRSSPLRRVVGLGIFMLAALGGCATGTPAASEREAPAMSASSLRMLPTFRGDGSPVAFDEIVRAAASAEVVMVGENHGHAVGLPWAAIFFDDLLESAPSAALSLEFFERDDQSRIDDYLKGMTDDAAFRKRTDRTPGSYPEGHRQMLEAAKARGRPVIAANSTWEIIRFLRGKNYDDLRTLTPEQQRLFRIPDAPPQGRYRADFDALMGQFIGMEHGAAPNAAPPPPMTPEQKQAALDGRFRPQYLWDWTMGESVARAVDAGSHPVVHVVGRFHSDFRGGTPQAVMALRPATRMVLISVVDADSTSLRDEDKGRADFVVYVGPSAEGGE